MKRGRRGGRRGGRVGSTSSPPVGGGRLLWRRERLLERLNDAEELRHDDLAQPSARRHVIWRGEQRAGLSRDRCNRRRSGNEASACRHAAATARAMGASANGRELILCGNEVVHKLACHFERRRDVGDFAEHRLGEQLHLRSRRGTKQKW